MVQVRQPCLPDRQQHTLLRHCLHVPGSLTAERRDPKITALPDLPGGQRIHRLVRKLRKQPRGRHESLFQPLLGGQYPQLVERVRLQSNSAMVRVIGPDDMVTMDHREDRLNLHLDAQNSIVRVHCG